MFLVSLSLYIHSVWFTHSICGIFVHSSPVYVCHSCLFVGPNKFGTHIHSVSLRTLCVFISWSQVTDRCSHFHPKKKILSQLSKKILHLAALSRETCPHLHCNQTYKHKQTLTNTDSFAWEYGAFDSFSLSPFHSFVRLFGSVAVCWNIHVAGLHFSFHSTVAVAAHHFVLFCSDE